jgi:hypothetical protein
MLATALKGAPAVRHHHYLNVARRAFRLLDSITMVAAISSLSNACVYLTYIVGRCVGLGLK